MTTGTGAAFDRAYIGFQLENHEYPAGPRGRLFAQLGRRLPTRWRSKGRHLAMLMLAVFKEHVAICKRLTAELKA